MIKHKCAVSTHLFVTLSTWIFYHNKKSKSQMSHHIAMLSPYYIVPPPMQAFTTTDYLTGDWSESKIEKL